MDFLTTNDVAKVLGVASTTVIFYERTGKIPAIRTAGGMRLFFRETVEEFLANRKSETPALIINNPKRPELK